jgi:transcriptional regulator with XRE-family HTH domain
MTARGPGFMPRRQRGDGPFPANLAFALRRRSMTAAELADVLGECPRRMRRLAAGETLPHYAEIADIAEVLRVPPAALAWDEPASFCARFKPLRSIPEADELRDHLI